MFYDSRSAGQARRFALRPRLELLEDRRLLYAQGGPDANGNFVDTPVHQWITQQAHSFYGDQFGASQVDNFLGVVGIYPDGANNRVIEGAFDEDVPFENPWDEGGGFQDLDHPSTRHFWAHDANYARSFDDGIASYDSAANRALKYFTGGFGLTHAFDSDWGSSTRPGNVAAQGQGIDELYSQNPAQSYYWLGHVAHLLQDLTVPSHAHADAHADRGVLADPDPLHDWVDGAVFSTNPQDGRPEAAFDDSTFRRWETWRFQAGIGANGAGGVGHAGTLAIDSGLLRSPEEIWLDVQSRFASQPELPASIPSGADADVLPLYALLLETAALADDFDTKDAIGQVDRGARRGSTSSSGSGYNQFTRDELNQMADVLVPRAMRTTAELLRYFYSTVDAAAPTVALVGLGSQPVGDPLDVSSSRIKLTAAASDQDTGDSGVGKNLFRFEFRARAPGGVFSDWQVIDAGIQSSTFSDGGALAPQFAGKHGMAAATQFQGQPGYIYGFRVSAEDGAGQRSLSAESYVEVSPLAQGPLPDTAGLYSAADGAFFLRYANESGVADSAFGYGPAGGSFKALSGDWDASDMPGGDSVGLFEPTGSVFFLRNDNAPGAADIAYAFGPAGSHWTPLVGDWNGDGTDTVGLFNPATSTFFLRNSHAGGAADVAFDFGPAGVNWTPVAGDWDGDGDDTIGLFNPVTSTFFLRNSLTAGAADSVAAYGPAGAGWVPLAGDWDSDGDDTLGLFNGTNSSFFLRNAITPGIADVAFNYGPAAAGWLPTVGQWQRLIRRTALVESWSSVATNAVAILAPPTSAKPQDSARVTESTERVAKSSPVTSVISPMTSEQLGQAYSRVSDADRRIASLAGRQIARARHLPRRELDVVFAEWTH